MGENEINEDTMILDNNDSVLFSKTVMEKIEISDFNLKKMKSARQEKRLNIVCLKSGTITFAILGNEILLTENEVLIISSCACKFLEVLEKNGKVVVISVSLEILKNSMSDNIGTSNFKRFINDSLLEDNTAFKKSNLKLLDKEIIKNLVKLKNGNKSTTHIQFLVIYILNELLAGEIFPLDKLDYKLENDFVNTTIKYIDLNFSNASLESLSQELFISYNHLSTMIKKEFGVTFKVLLQKKRMEIAFKLLQETTRTVKEISNIVGYENNSFFYKLFTKYYQINPSEARKKSTTND